MSVGCVILNYNDAETTLSLLNSIAGYDTIDEIVIVDNHSSDKSVETISDSISMIGKAKLLTSDTNKGYGGGNNVGLEYCRNRHEFVLIANPDVIFHETCVERMIMEFQKDSKVAVVACTQLNAKRQVYNGFAWQLMPVTEYIASFSRLFWFLHRKSQARYEEIKNLESYATDCVPGAMLMIRIGMFQAPIYDENIFLYGEETVIALKCRKMQYKTILLPTERYIHNHSVSIDKSYHSKSKKRRMMRNSGYYILKEYYGAGKPELALTKCFFAYCALETYFIDFIDRFRQ